jgi:hypothetical protein
MTDINYHHPLFSGSSYKKSNRLYSRGDIYRIFNICIDAHFGFAWSPATHDNIRLFVYPVGMQVSLLVINGEIDYQSFHSLN